MKNAAKKFVLFAKFKDGQRLLTKHRKYNSLQKHG